MKHSRIGASGSHIWMNCLGQPNFVRKHNIRSKPSIYSATGTVVHTVCEECLRHNLEPIEFLDRVYVEKVGDEDEEITVTEEMVDSAKIYVDYIRGVLDKTDNGVLLVEEKFHLKDIHPDLYGTNDASIIQIYQHLHVFDYKNGVKYVEVENNSQLLYYAVGAATLVNYDFENMTLHVVQPNCYGVEACRSWTISSRKLKAWEGELKKAAHATSQPDAPLTAGSHCEWCPAKIVNKDTGVTLCPAHHKYIMDIPLQAFKEEERAKATKLPEPATLTPEQVAWVLDNKDVLKKWFSTVEALATEEANIGRAPKGYKLVEGRKGNRKWRDEEEVKKELSQAFPTGVSIYKEPELLSPAQVDKVLGSGGKKITDKLTTRTDGKRKLVRDYHLGKEIKPLELIFSPLPESS